MNAKTRIRKKVLSLHGLHGPHSLHGLQSAVCSLHGLRFGVTGGNPKRRILLKANFSFFTSLSTGEARVFGVKFIGRYGTDGFLAIRDFSF